MFGFPTNFEQLYDTGKELGRGTFGTTYVCTKKGVSAEERAKLLQFVTGTSRVPAQGFCALQSRDGTLCPFTVAPISKRESIVPRAHTCFNRIDLPLYSSHDELDRFLGMVTQMDVTGFQME